MSCPLVLATPTVAPAHISYCRDVRWPAGTVCRFIGWAHREDSQSATVTGWLVSLTNGSELTSPGGGSKSHGFITARAATQPPNSTRHEATSIATNARRPLPRGAPAQNS